LFKGKRKYTDGGFVFTTRYGTPVEPRCYNKIFDGVKEKVGFEKYTPHSLRHTGIELMKNKRFDYTALQFYVGHKNPDITGTYLTRLKDLAREE